MDESRKLKECIRETIKTYRQETGFIGGSSIEDRDQRALVHRISDAVSTKLGEIDRSEVEGLYQEIEQLQEEVRLSSGSQYGELRQEYEAIKALAKHLIYRLDAEETGVSVSLDTLHDMEERVSLVVDEKDGEVTITINEYE